MSDYFDRIERQLAGAAEAQPQPTRPRPRTVVGALLAAAATVAVVVVAATVGHPAGDGPPAAGAQPTAIVLRPDSSAPPNRSALNSDVAILRQRLQSAFPGVNVARTGDTIVLANVRRAQRASVLGLTEPGRLRFFDWEANVLLPGGRTVASLLPRRDPRALEISQGLGAAVPGLAGAGGLPLLEAIKLADHDRTVIRHAVGPATAVQAFLFRTHCRPTPRQSCLLAGPAVGRAALVAARPGASSAGTRVYTVPSGLLVVQASLSAASGPISFAAPATRYFVVRSDPALKGTNLTDPQPSTDQAGNPDVTFGFSASGQSAFERVTRVIAHRGDVVSGLGQSLNQHFAVTLDERILTVPSIDFKTYPDGIAGGGGADITGGFTSRTARELATLLESGPLPVALIPVS
jgi:hypothetical protein